MLLVFMLILGIGPMAYAQKTLKIGHVNVDSIAQLMPEIDTMMSAIDAKKAVQNKTIRIEEENVKNLYLSYQNNKEGMPPQWIEDKEREIMTKQQAIENLKQVTFPSELQEIQEEYLQKMYDKITDAIKGLAQEMNYTYVLNSAEGLSGVLYASPAEDITGLIIKRMKLDPTVVRNPGN